MSSSPAPQQLLLDLGPPPAPTLDNFVAGSNAEVLRALANLSQPGAAERCIYLWGANGSGRSHLLRAVSSLERGRYLRCIADSPEADASQAAEISEAAEYVEMIGNAARGPIPVWTIDDVENAGAEMQIALFNLINEVRADTARRTAIVVAGDRPPLALALREDLRSRLGWGLVFQVHLLTDEEKDAALSRHAAERGVALPPEVRRYLLRNFSRDLNSLMSLVGALDAYGMRHHRALTVPLLRELVQELPTVAEAAGGERLV